MKQNSVSFPCGELILEGIQHLPEGSGPFPTVVLCHPHPVYGGSMSNNVISALCFALVSKAIIAFRFNFRGVGNSQGKFGGGIEEQKDVTAAFNFVASLPEVDIQRLGVAGYSFGAAVALPVALDDDRIQAMALISPPLAPSDLSQLKNCPKPQLVIWGSEDFIIPSPEVGLITQKPELKQLEIISGADHFWWGYEAEVAEKVSAFFSRQLEGRDLLL